MDIVNIKKFEKKTLKEILDEIDAKNNKIPDFNYLHLISLNSFKELITKQKENEINIININNNGRNEIKNKTNETRINNLNIDKNILK